MRPKAAISYHPSTVVHGITPICSHHEVRPDFEHTLPFSETQKRALEKGSVLMKAISFGLVGVVNTLVDLGVFWIALKIIGLPLLLANLLAWFVAVSGSYILNCFTTFAAESGRKLEPRKYASFIASGIAGFVGGTATLAIGAIFVPILVAKLVAIAISFALNFSLSHFVIFRPSANSASS